MLLLLAIAFTPLLDSLSLIRVPSLDGFNVFKTLTGIFLALAGLSALGWITLAPNDANSEASLYESSFIGLASCTILGSAVNTPLTSVHICNSSASTAFAIIAAL